MQWLAEVVLQMECRAAVKPGCAAVSAHLSQKHSALQAAVCRCLSKDRHFSKVKHRFKVSSCCTFSICQEIQEQLVQEHSLLQKQTITVRLYQASSNYFKILMESQRVTINTWTCRFLFIEMLCKLWHRFVKIKKLTSKDKTGVWHC